MTHWSDYWSKQLNCEVSHLEKEEPFLVLEEEEDDNGKYIKILRTNNGKTGWIIYEDWIAYTEEAVNNE